ncbi:hypothetical protein Poli38472_004158 [Pythium oligandrum]|uniref:Uncharacterized protein n=1 Tax=Pythium oligandrum TaxID=41045 RepID=A0A8K1CNZ7_PYTOL|nr:hypothetical protein Poli38472_004158 [Pythium oligandrum]|eukprot:TMW66393.1 hypothetical protein Poli38472_004158 [Pythium oligandrum]
MMNDASFVAMTSPMGRRAHSLIELSSNVERLETASQVDRALCMDSSVSENERMTGDGHRVQFNGVARKSDRSSHVSRSDMGRSLAHVYEPTLQERAQHFLEGPSGLYLELVNFAFSVLIFALYIAELYHPNLGGLVTKRAIELTLTSFFILDLGLHLFVAPRPLQYLFSIYGMIDVITIIPSFFIFFVTRTKSQAFFVLRVLRIFRSLRVLRLKRFIKFKRHGFNYELSVFLLSSIAVILCAAGLYHAMEEPHYLNDNGAFRFHEALYFILVTISTIGYGDISPQTSLGQVFVMLLIIAVFTIVPQKAAKLNDLAKLNHAYDGDYTRRDSRSGHVIVSGYELRMDSILDFLDEFYHCSRGNIHLDVVFMCEAPPSPEVTRLLATDRNAIRTRYLRGSLSNAIDQQRARLGESTAVFFLANKLFRSYSAQQDAAMLLHTLSVRNFADSSGKCLDIYLQLRSHDPELEMTSQLLGGNTTNTSELRTMILARATTCPGASTLILNLLQSVSTAEYMKSYQGSKLWIEEYVDGMSFQLFPIIFTKKFQYEKYDDVVRNIYERYNALLITIRPRRSGRSSGEEEMEDPELRIAPFQTTIRVGDVGIVLAKTASDVLHIATSYGYWSEEMGCRVTTSQLVRPVRVSSDSLIKRPTNSFWSSDSWSIPVMDAYSTSIRRSVAMATNPSPMARSPRTSLGKTDEIISATTPPSIVMMPIIEAVRTKQIDLVQKILEKDHFIFDGKHLEGHFVVCAGRLRETLSIVAFIKHFCALEQRVRPGVVAALASIHVGSVPRYNSDPTCVLLVENLPKAEKLAQVLKRIEEKGEDISSLMQNVLFLEGNAAKVCDLGNAGIQSARRVLLMPSQAEAARFKFNPTSPDPSSATRHVTTPRYESLADFGVINSLLVAEVVRDELSSQSSGRFSPRRRQSSRQHLNGENSESALDFYRRQEEQGIPLESIKLRMLERFPDMDPRAFDDGDDMIGDALQLYDQSHSQPDDGGIMDANRDRDGADDLDGLNMIAMLHHASSARFCRPQDPAVCHDEFPYLSPSFASGNVFLSSVLDRVICQAFYNPYITDVVRALAVGHDPTTTFPTIDETRPEQSQNPGAARKPSGGSSQNTSRRLFQVVVHESYVGSTFFNAFQDFLSINMLVIGLLRYPSPVLENFRPYVYTCPAPETTLHSNDRFFVLG